MKGRSEEQSTEKRKKGKREKKKFKMHVNSNHVYLRGYCSSCGSIVNLNLIDASVFWGEMCKTNIFFYFPMIDTYTLRFYLTS